MTPAGVTVIGDPASTGVPKGGSDPGRVTLVIAEKALARVATMLHWVPSYGYQLLMEAYRPMVLPPTGRGTGSVQVPEVTVEGPEQPTPQPHQTVALVGKAEASVGVP